MRTILCFILALMVGPMTAQTETEKRTIKPDTTTEKHSIDHEANKKAMSDLRKKNAQRQQKNIRKYKGKKSHLSQSEKAVKEEEVVIPAGVSESGK